LGMLLRYPDTNNHLKQCKYRMRWYSKEKSFVPPKEISERIRNEARARRLTHLAHFRKGNAREPETPALEILCRALATSSGSSSSSVKGVKSMRVSVGQKAKRPSDKSLKNEQHYFSLIPPENIKQGPDIQLDKADTDTLEIFSCKNCHENSAGEDLESHLKLEKCSNAIANNSVLKKPQQSTESTLGKQGTAFPPPQADTSVPQKQTPVKGAQRKANAAISPSEKPPQNLTHAATKPSEAPFPLERNQEIRNQKDDKQDNGEIAKNAALRRWSCIEENMESMPKKDDETEDKFNKQKMEESKEEIATKSSAQGAAQESVNPSQPEEQKLKPVEKEDSPKAAGTSSASPFPAGRNPCKDGKRGNGEKSQDASQKRSSDDEENMKAVPDPARSNGKNSKDVLEPNACAEEIMEPYPEVKEMNEDSNNKQEMKKSQDVVAQPKGSQVKQDDPFKATHQSQTAKLPPLPTSSFHFPLLSAFPSGRNPCRDGPRGESKKEQEAEGKAEYHEESAEESKEESPEESPEESLEESLEERLEESLEESLEGSLEESLEESTKFEEEPEKSYIENTSSWKEMTQESSLIDEASDGLENYEATADDCNSSQSEMAPTPDQEIEASEDHPMDSADFVPSESLEAKPVEETAQEASASVSSKESEEVRADAQEASDAVYREESTYLEEPNESPKLKRFPAAPLKRTLEAYLDSIEPLLTDNEFEKQLKLAEEFEKKEGRELQELLEEAAASCCNWLTPRWTQAAYLAYQAPVTAFTSPALSFPVQEFKDPMDCLIFTARAIRAIYEFKTLVDEEKIPVTKMDDNPLDNSQFSHVFGTVRKPGRFCDTIEQYSDSDYVVVVYRNNYFKLPILSSSGNALSVARLMDELEAIINCPLEKGEPFGLLTHDNRGNWAEAYNAMFCLPGNEDTLETIEHSLFVVCLDQCVPIPKDQQYVVQAHQLLHGGGLAVNSANRWMDKTIQLIVNPNGLAGFCYEHSPAECQPLAMLMDYSEFESESEFECQEDDNCENSNQARHLKFQPSDECLNMWLHVAMRNIGKIATNLQMHVFEYECHGKDFIKAQGLNSDSYIQMALQLAYYNVHKTLPAQYESAHLRMFIDGRTETIRSTSSKSKDFVLAMKSKNASVRQKLRALQGAVDFHEQLTKRALNGEGIDRHLFGLQQMAVENDLPMPEFFKSKGFLRSVSFQLFTSQVATSHKSFMAYGPLTCDGYGCCYNPQDNTITFTISAWPTAGVKPEEYGKAIKKSLDSMRRLILKTGGDRVGEDPCRCEDILN
ncbi:hypothetical protein KR038_003134, partial [Drosophila bunnanda]